MATSQSSAAAPRASPWRSNSRSIFGTCSFWNLVQRHSSRRRKTSIAANSSVTHNRIWTPAGFAFWVDRPTIGPANVPRSNSVDFERMPDRPYSGWPLDFAVLAPFYDRAHWYCEINGFSSPSQASRSAAAKLIDSHDLELTEFHYSPPTRFGERFRGKLASSDRIKVYLHANVTNILTAENGTHLTSIDAQTLSGRKIAVTASAYVLCCGGIENARILLNCTQRFSVGIGNHHDLVGRFFMDHLVATMGGVIVPQIEISDLGPLHTWHDGSMFVRGALMNSAATVRQAGRRGCTLIMHPIYRVNKAGPNAMQSPSYEAFQRIIQYAKRGHLAPNFGENGCIALEEPQAIARSLYYRLAKRLHPERTVEAIRVHIEGEQAPNPRSRVMLVNDIDALGMRRAALVWNIDRTDSNNLYQTLMELARSVGAAGFGRMALNLEPGNELSKISTAWHHMGTTRMHDDQRHGVVDRHCAVHGLANFYIAGSSVFTTGGRVNPTLTIVALAIRLADHLKLTVKP